MIETGFELIDAIINNPIQSVLLFIIGYVLYKFFCGCRDNIFGELRYGIQRSLHWKFVHFLRWLDRRDQAFNKWAQTKTKKDWLKISLTIWSCLFLPLLIWNIFFPSFLSDTNEINYLLVTILTIEYVFFVIISIHTYRKKEKEIKN